MLQLGKEFPFWTVCISFYISHPTTSYCERIFNDIKNEIFKNYSLPQRIDNFIKIHLRDLIGGKRSFSTKKQNFVVNEKIVSTWKPKNFYQYFIDQVTAKTNTTKLYNNIQNTEIEHCYFKSFDDSDLLSRENLHKKAESIFSFNGNERKIF